MKDPSINASYQVSFHLAEGFQRRGLKCEKLTTTDDRRRTPSDGKSSHCRWQGELKKLRYMCISITNAFFSILMHLSVIQFIYL
jgi:hypothetical protein